ncbi:MAG: hypothetical protein ACRCSP_01630 [Rhodoglobus sp.]
MKAGNFSQPIDSQGGRIARRHILKIAAAGAATLVMTNMTSGSAFATTSPIPLLPGEISRLTNQITRIGKVPYENVLVSINGDLARLMIPWTAIPGSTNRVGVVWFYHAAGSSHSALSSAFKYSSELCVDQGAVTICQNAGGSQYTNVIAQTAQRNGWTYMSSVFSVGVNLLRANSGGGSLACATYAEKLIPQVRGMYLASGSYDMEKLYATDPARIGLAYNNDPALVAASNPARLGPEFWAGSRIRVACADPSEPDPIVPSTDHGLALINKIQGYAIENSSRFYLGGGHQVPSWTSLDMMAAFQRWLS